MRRILLQGSNVDVRDAGAYGPSPKQELGKLLAFQLQPPILLGQRTVTGKVAITNKVQNVEFGDCTVALKHLLDHNLCQYLCMFLSISLPTHLSAYVPA